MQSCDRLSHEGEGRAGFCLGNMSTVILRSGFTIKYRVRDKGGGACPLVPPPPHFVLRQKM